MRSPTRFLPLVMITSLLSAPLVAQQTTPLDFARDVRPILSENCFQCHGPDDNARKAGLRLDRREGALADLGGHAAVIPGRPDKSELIARITHRDPSERMPQQKTGKQLTPEQIATLRRWIEEGAQWSEHWAFVPPQRPALPRVVNRSWPRNAIDHFVLARLEQRGTRPAPEADRSTWLRRVSFDLTGLPPSLAQIDAFLADRTPAAFERVVDALLASPRYGEHWARSWLDIARYADTDGYQYDRERTQWPWRDWVINAYNQNMPFDQFTVEQLGGDLLPNATVQQQAGTGFNRNHPITIEGGVIDEEYRTEYVIDRVVTTSTAWMGMTFLCARCHDHKYDPLSQREFYEFFAFFNQVPERGLQGFEPRIAMPSKEHDDAKLALATLEATVAKASATLRPQRLAWEKSLVAKRGADPWVVQDPAHPTASSGASLEALPDKSFLASGGDLGKETYELLIRTDLTNITAIRIECLTHKSLPHGGAGRASNSNFVLSGFEAAARLAGSTQAHIPLKLASAVADYSQRNYEIAKAIDGNPGTGWAVDGPTRKEDRVAVFTPTRPFGWEAGTELRVRLQQHFGTGHAIGRLRVSLSTQAGVGIQAGIADFAATEEAARTPTQRRSLTEAFMKQAAPPVVRDDYLRIPALRKNVAATNARRVRLMVMRDLATPRKTHVLERGEYHRKLAEVTAGTPAALPPMAKELPRNRLGLARWLVSGQHPLTARVAVNRYWQAFFDTGIVKTAENFGSQSEYPSHPVLLDWLATEFVGTDWDVKRMHKLITLSATYRQSSKVSRRDAVRDPANRWLARGPSRRLDAEEIRDQALMVSGLLIDKIGGKSVFPYHPKGLWMEINNRPGYSRPYPHQTTPDHLYRRSLYTFWKRTVPPPTMQAFDAPEREFCVVRRSSTNTPLQPFVLMHDPQFVEAARHLGARMMREGGKNNRQRIEMGFRLVTGRRPSPSERAILAGTVTRRLALYRQDSAAAARLLDVGVSKSGKPLDRAEHAAWTAVARLLINLSEAVTRG
ncbi:MAG: PSD1 and planctomycete cytochrome C domain-containing protein [Planctomycetota bacterium]|nr:PSD1 and planctomycete cytochrome C domain-containing protein [Planctomycetota bacterium]